MSMTDPIADLITRLRNAQRAAKETVVCLHSVLAENCLNVLKDEGYIEGYVKEQVRPGIHRLVVTLRYYQGEPSIKMIRRVSKPGRRVYSPIAALRRVFNGMGVSVISTSKGVISDGRAREHNVGGEVLFEVY